MLVIGALWLTLRTSLGYLRIGYQFKRNELRNAER